MLEPGACLTISNALNKKNEAAMKTGSGEILRYKIQLCNPAPQKTLWDHVRDEVIRRYGAAGDDNYLPHAFQYIMEAGGRGSRHLNDYTEFVSLTSASGSRPKPTKSPGLSSSHAWRQS